ncbi:MAG TPA: Hsp20/alpha crystallin family protein [Nitrososphaeraceae archaeon]|nr:Hsp20/alpha crystallin family protein [Nitrososphaeraceae archaeon]
MPSSGKANRRRKEEGEGKEEKSFRPKLSDFKRKTGEGEDKGSLPHSRGIDNMRRRERVEEKSLQARRMDDIFEDFRNNIESILNPWSSSSSYLWHSPSKLEIEEEEEAEEKDEEIRRTPLYDMVDKGDRYELEVEVPGIDRDKIHVKATDDSIEISAEQLEEERVEERKKKYVYNERSYRSFYRTIPIPEQILSSEVTAKMNNGILRIDLPKKMPTKPKGVKIRSITVE